MQRLPPFPATLYWNLLSIKTNICRNVTKHNLGWYFLFGVGGFLVRLFPFIFPFFFFPHLFFLCRHAVKCVGSFKQQKSLTFKINLQGIYWLLECKKCCNLLLLAWTSSVWFLAIVLGINRSKCVGLST